MPSVSMPARFVFGFCHLTLSIMVLVRRGTILLRHRSVGLEWVSVAYRRVDPDPRDGGERVG